MVRTIVLEHAWAPGSIPGGRTTAIDGTTCKSVNIFAFSLVFHNIESVENVVFYLVLNQMERGSIRG